MNKSSSYNRWYDQEPTVSIAVSLLRNASEKNQKKVAEYFVQKYSIPIQRNTFKKFGFFKKRWYDFDEAVFSTLEYIRVAAVNVQKEIALEMINLLYELESTINSELI